MGLTIDAKKILLQKRLLQDIKRKSKDEKKKILDEYREPLKTVF